MAKPTQQAPRAGRVAGVAPGTGVIRGIDAATRRVRLEHGALPEAGMAAMTMAFEALGDVDLSSYADGDEVGFRLKRGVDGTWRIAALCEAGAAVPGCGTAP